MQLNYEFEVERNCYLEALFKNDDDKNIQSTVYMFNNGNEYVGSLVGLMGVRTLGFGLFNSICVVAEIIVFKSVMANLQVKAKVNDMRLIALLIFLRCTYPTIYFCYSFSDILK